MPSLTQILYGKGNREDKPSLDISGSFETGGLFGKGGVSENVSDVLAPLSGPLAAAKGVTGFLTGIADAKTGEYIRRKEDEMMRNRMSMIANQMTSQDFAARRGAAEADAARMGGVRPFTSMLERTSTLGA